MLAAAGSIFMMTWVKSHSYVWDLQTDSQIVQTSLDISTVKQIIFWGVIGLSGFTILIGFLGFLTARLKTCCTISFYSFFTLILFVAFALIGGLLMTTVTVAADFQVDQYCQQQNQSSQSNSTSNSTYDSFTVNFSRYFLQYVSDYDTATSQLVDTYMCSNMCPCTAVNQSLYSQGFGRDVSLLFFDGFYSNFSSCYNDMVMDNRIPNTLSQPIDKHYQVCMYVKKPMLSLIAYLENTYQCSSICQVPYFYFATDFRNGPPTQTCSHGLKALYNTTFGILALLLLITGLFLFFAFNAQYGLWKRRFVKNAKRLSELARADRSQNYLVEEVR